MGKVIDKSSYFGMKRHRQAAKALMHANMRAHIDDAIRRVTAARERQEQAERAEMIAAGKLVAKVER